MKQYSSSRIMAGLLIEWANSLISSTKKLVQKLEKKFTIPPARLARKRASVDLDGITDNFYKGQEHDNSFFRGPASSFDSQAGRPFKRRAISPDFTSGLETNQNNEQ